MRHVETSGRDGENAGLFGMLLALALAVFLCAWPGVREAAARELEGTLEVQVEDYPDFSRTRVFVRTSRGRIPLKLKSASAGSLQAGAHVRVDSLGKPVALTSSSGRMSRSSGPGTSPPPSGAPLPNTFGAQSALVMLVNFQDDPTNTPYTIAEAQTAVFGNANNFFLENSYQQTSLSGATVGWYTIPVSSTSCDMSSIANYARAAASAAGVNLSAYAHYLYAFPLNNNCGWAGSSFIGGTPGQSWLNGSLLNAHIVDHELGHQLGLYHSHLLDCGTSATIGTGCNVIEYGDILDTIGAPQTPSPHFNAFQKERLGWLNYGASPSIITAQNPGTYVINAYEDGGAGPNALKILKSIDPSTGAKTWYYVEARRAIGFDEFIASESSENETGGVLVHIGTDGNGNSDDLLDMTPATPTYYWWFDPSLATGSSFEDISSGVGLTTEWVTSTQAAVTVQFSGAIAVTANQSSYSPGQTATMTATVGLGGTPIANASVKFTLTKSNGSVVTGSATTNSKGMAALSIKLKSTDPAGTYQVGAASVVDGATVSASTTFAVQ